MQTYLSSLIRQLDAHNALRMCRALELLSAKQRQVIELVPALLHYHHPALPGYCDGAIPFGIDQYQASDELVQDLQSMGLPALQSIHSPDILALNSMGSSASMGQSLTSDFDIWICVAPSFPTESRQALERKSELISAWAMEKGLEVNFFVVDESRFRQQRFESLTGDNCGSTQHFLLLDEFYRSAVKMAGRRLLWRVIPVEHEHQYDAYVQRLCDEGVINRDEWVDFGGVPTIPAAEYFGSSLWQLYKSIDSPYKSVLKALLLEAYSWEYPNIQLLSIEAKQRWMTSSAGDYRHDAYYLMLDKVTRYLSMINDQRRLDLVRRCFYLKTHEKLSQNAKLGSMPWRREVLQGLTREWGWSDAQIFELDHRRDWKVEQVKIAHNELLDALMLSYRNLIRFARRNNITSSVSPEDISILARKLYATFEVLPGKVTLLNPQLSPDLYEPNLTLIQVPKGHSTSAGWYLYKQALVPHEIIGRAPLEHNRYLSKLIAWAFFNGLLTDSTHLDTVVRQADVDIDKLYQLVSDIRNTFSIRTDKPSLQALSSPCEIRQLALFVNIEQDPTKHLKLKTSREDQRHVDIFSYGEHAEHCLVGSVDLIYRNSWNEVRTLNFSGPNAMLDALKTVLGKMHQDALPPHSVDVFCYSQQLRGLIRNRVYQLLAECIEMRLKPVDEFEKNRTFKAIRLANKTYGMFFERRGVTIQKLENSVDFYRHISTSKVNKGSIQWTRDEHHQVPEVVDANASEGLVQFFFEAVSGADQCYNIYILDEANDAEVYHQCHTNKDEMVNQVNHFYTASQDLAQASGNFNLPQFYDLVRDVNGQLIVQCYRRCQCTANEALLPSAEAASLSGVPVVRVLTH